MHRASSGRCISKDGACRRITRRRDSGEKRLPHGSSSAQSDLGLLYFKGLGGTQGLVQVYRWYSLAAGNGYEIATGYRNDLAKQMTPAQIAEA